MDREELTKRLIDRENVTRDVRAERWGELAPATESGGLPHLVWRYLTEAEEMYVNGFFIGVIMVCAGTVELTLSDRIASRLKISERDIARFELFQFIVLARALEMLTEAEAADLDQFRFLRNGLIHGNSGKLAETSKKLYQGNGLGEAPPVETYLSPTTGNGINHDALRFLRLTRSLILRFYGEKPHSDRPGPPALERK